MIIHVHCPDCNATEIVHINNLRVATALDHMGRCCDACYLLRKAKMSSTHPVGFASSSEAFEARADINDSCGPFWKGPCGGGKRIIRKGGQMGG